MAQAVALGWTGQYAGMGGPLASGASDPWVAWGDWGQENRFYSVTAFCDGSIAADIQVVNLSHYRVLNPDGTITDETHFQIRNNGSPAPVYYYFYYAWSDPINV